jgi:uncharacterized membrane protein
VSTATAPDGAPAGTAPARRRIAPVSLPGAWAAMVFAALSFTPSLLPRSGLFQGAVAGISAATGYALGVAGAWLWRQFADRPARAPRRRSWQVFAVVAVLVLAVAAALGYRWQQQLRTLMGMPGGGALDPVLTVVVAAALLVVLVLVGRLLARAARAVGALLSRLMGERAARTLGWVLVGAAFVVLLNGALYTPALDLADRTFALQDTITPDGVTRPASPLRAGGPGSLVPWDSLGREGRTFSASGPDVADLSAFNGGPATEPVRIFAGLESADDAQARAALAVRDLERAGGFARSHLLVATTTGSGFLEPSSVDSFEYLTSGDSAIVSIQYSYLPSWISFLADQRRAREAGRELFDAVYDRWSDLPADARPRLFVFGESLGSFGGETAFSGSYDLANRTSGAVFVGAPSFNTLAGEFTAERAPASREIEPVFRDGAIVRFTNDITADIPPDDRRWDGTRVLYLQYPSDPIVWWNPDLLLQRPDWLEEARGRDVLADMQWIPFVTFWQVSADMVHSTATPSGHGHVYRGDHADAWATILQPPGWSPERSRELRQLTGGD